MRPLWDEALDRHLQIARVFARADGPIWFHTLFAQVAVGFGDADTQATILSEQIMAAPTYAVTEEMCRVIEHGATELEGRSVPLHLDHNVPSPSGFVWLARPQPWPTMAPPLDGEYGDEGVERTILVRGLWWHPSDVGVRRNSGADVYLTTGLTTGLVVSRHDALNDEAAHLGRVPDMVPFDVTAWAADLGWVEGTTDEWRAARDSGEFGVVAPWGGWWRRWMLAFFALATDHIAAVPVSRGVRKRAAREQRGGAAAPDFGQVRVVVLRRRTATPDGHEPVATAVTWSHRWLVSGHWRFQPYGPGRALRRLQWIAPYVKGPEGRPLIVRDDVNLLAR